MSVAQLQELRLEGNDHVAKNRLDQAIQTFRAAVQLFVDHRLTTCDSIAALEEYVQVAGNLCTCLHRQGELCTCMSTALDLLAIYPAIPQAYSSIGMCIVDKMIDQLRSREQQALQHISEVGNSGHTLDELRTDSLRYLVKLAGVVCTIDEAHMYLCRAVLLSHGALQVTVAPYIETAVRYIDEQIFTSSAALEHRYGPNLMDRLLPLDPMPNSTARTVEMAIEERKAGMRVSNCGGGAGGGALLAPLSMRRMTESGESKSVMAMHPPYSMTVLYDRCEPAHDNSNSNSSNSNNDNSGDQEADGSSNNNTNTDRNGSEDNNNSMHTIYHRNSNNDNCPNLDDMYVCDGGGAARIAEMTPECTHAPCNPTPCETCEERTMEVISESRSFAAPNSNNSSSRSHDDAAEESVNDTNRYSTVMDAVSAAESDAEVESVPSPLPVRPVDVHALTNRRDRSGATGPTNSMNDLHDTVHSSTHVHIRSAANSTNNASDANVHDTPSGDHDTDDMCDVNTSNDELSIRVNRCGAGPSSVCINAQIHDSWTWRTKSNAASSHSFALLSSPTQQQQQIASPRDFALSGCTVAVRVCHSERGGVPRGMKVARAARPFAAALWIEASEGSAQHSSCGSGCSNANDGSPTFPDAQDEWQDEQQETTRLTSSARVMRAACCVACGKRIDALATVTAQATSVPRAIASSSTSPPSPSSSSHSNARAACAVAVPDVATPPRVMMASPMRRWATVCSESNSHARRRGGGNESSVTRYVVWGGTACGCDLCGAVAYCSRSCADSYRARHSQFECALFRRLHRIVARECGNLYIQSNSSPSRDTDNERPIRNGNNITDSDRSPRVRVAATANTAAVAQAMTPSPELAAHAARPRSMRGNDASLRSFAPLDSLHGILESGQHEQSSHSRSSSGHRDNSDLHHASRHVSDHNHTPAPCARVARSQSVRAVLVRTCPARECNGSCCCCCNGNEATEYSPIVSSSTSLSSPHSMAAATTTAAVEVVPSEQQQSVAAEAPTSAPSLTVCAPAHSFEAVRMLGGDVESMRAISAAAALRRWSTPTLLRHSLPLAIAMYSGVRCRAPGWQTVAAQLERGVQECIWARLPVLVRHVVKELCRADESCNTGNVSHSAIERRARAADERGGNGNEACDAAHASAVRVDLINDALDRRSCSRASNDTGNGTGSSTDTDAAVQVSLYSTATTPSASKSQPSLTPNTTPDLACLLPCLLLLARLHATEMDEYRSSLFFSEKLMLRHSCEPNCYWDRILQCITTSRFIHKGEELTMTVDDNFPQHWPLRPRQRWLNHAHGFTCACVRCVRESAAASPSSSSLSSPSEEEAKSDTTATSSEVRWQQVRHACAASMGEIYECCSGRAHHYRRGANTRRTSSFAAAAAAAIVVAMPARSRYPSPTPSPRPRSHGGQRGRISIDSEDDSCICDDGNVQSVAVARCIAPQLRQQQRQSCRAPKSLKYAYSPRFLCCQGQTTTEQLLRGVQLRQGRIEASGNERDSSSDNLCADSTRYFREMTRHATNANVAGAAPCLASNSSLRCLPLPTVLHDAQSHLLPSHYLLADLYEGTRRVAESRGNNDTVITEGKKELLFHESMWPGVTPAKLRIVRGLVITSDGSLRRHVPPRAPHNSRSSMTLPISSDWPSVMEWWRSPEVPNSQILESCYRFYEAWYS